MERAGVQLTWGVLIAIVVILILALIFVWIHESQSNDALRAAIGAVADSTPRHLPDTTAFRLIQSERAEFRDFWLRLVQLVLLNLLLPVLTALLGYVFGTQSRR